MEGIHRCLWTGCDALMFWHPDKGFWYCTSAHVNLAGDVDEFYVTETGGAS